MPKKKGRKNKSPRKPGKKVGSGSLPCQTGTVLAIVEYADRKQPLDGIKITLANDDVTHGPTLTAGGSVTFADVRKGDYDATIDEGDVDAANAHVVSLEEQPVTAAVGKIERVYFRVERLVLKLTKVDLQFASGAENLEIQYDIKWMTERTVTLRILGNDDELLHEVELSDDESADGTGKVLQWTGEITQGVKTGLFACPLDGPFKVQLLSDGMTTSELPFDIVYASLALELAPWADLYKAHTKLTSLDAPVGDDGNMRAWVAYKLNDLGFWAGPPDGTNSDELKRAIRAFRLAHPELCVFKTDKAFYERSGGAKEMVLSAQDSFFAIDKPLQTQLESDSPKVERQALSDKTAIADAGKGTKLFVDNTRYHIAEFAEFNAPNAPRNKYAAEQAWLGRPHLPIRCQVTLKDKTGAAKKAPKGIGKVPILWSWTDVAEADLRAKSLAPELPAYKTDEPSRVGDYVKDAQTAAKPGTRHGVNVTRGGILDGTDGDALAPLVVSATLNDSATNKAGKGVVARGSVAADRKEVLGAPVLYLKPSNVAGDSYQVQAALFLEDEPNEAKLTPRHTGVAPAKTGLVAIWRRLRIAAYVAWPKRAAFGLAGELAKIKKEFEPCLVELDISGVEELEAKNLVTDPDFQAVLEDAKIEDVETNGYLEAVKLRKFSDKSVYPGNPEDCESTFDAFVNRLVPKDSAHARVLAKAWKDHGKDADVIAAGTHFDTALPTLPFAPLVRSGTKITAVQIEELLLPKPVVDEVTAYVDGKSYDATQTAAMSIYLRDLGTWDTDNLYSELLQGQITAVTVKTTFKDSVTKLFRTAPLDLRKWVIRRRVGRLAGLVNARLAEKTDMVTRKHLATNAKVCDGAILLDYATSEEVDIRGEKFVVDGVAFGGLNGVAMLDQGLKSNFYSLAAHEIGHCMFLQHWKNAPTAVAANHDQADDNCMMSYPVYYKMADCNEAERAAFLQMQYLGSEHSTKAHYCYDKFKPHFCGKCNLQIRGWKLDGGEPARAPARAAVVPVKPVSVKLVRDTVAGNGKSATYADKDLTTIGVSFYPSHKAGAHSAAHLAFRLSALPEFPRTFGDSLDAALDPGTFRVEVKDPNLAVAVVYVTLEALRPTYPGPAWTEFTGEERKRRALVEVECAPIAGDPHVYRSRYLRLVTDEYDHKELAGSKQGLLVTDMVKKDSDADDDAVEILDQKIRVWYDPS